MILRAFVIIIIMIIIIIREVALRSLNRGPTKEPTKNFIILYVWSSPPPFTHGARRAEGTVGGLVYATGCN